MRELPAISRPQLAKLENRFSDLLSFTRRLAVSWNYGLLVSVTDVQGEQ